VIYRKQEFVEDQTGDPEFPIKVIDRLDSLDGEAFRFIGRATLNMKTPLGIQQFPISFEIVADSTDEAFQKYSQHARPKMEEVRRHIQSQLDRIHQEQEDEGALAPEKASGDGNIISLDDFKRRS